MVKEYIQKTKLNIKKCGIKISIKTLKGKIISVLDVKVNDKVEKIKYILR